MHIQHKLSDQIHEYAYEIFKYFYNRCPIINLKNTVFSKWYPNRKQRCSSILYWSGNFLTGNQLLDIVCRLRMECPDAQAFGGVTSVTASWGVVEVMSPAIPCRRCSQIQLKLEGWWKWRAGGKFMPFSIYHRTIISYNVCVCVSMWSEEIAFSIYLHKLRSQESRGDGQSNQKRLLQHI